MSITSMSFGHSPLNVDRNHFVVSAVGMNPPGPCSSTLMNVSRPIGYEITK